jgi:dihydroorotate dehydrogenase (fumarate)
VATDPLVPGMEIERRLVELVESVRSAVTIPLAVKLSPFYSSIPNLARRLVDVGADGLVLFNRSYYPAMDLDELTVRPMPDLSGSWELPLRLRWLGILFGHVNASLSVTGGVHTSDDAAKAILAGAESIQLVSVLLSRGPNYLKELLAGLQAWMRQHKFESLSACRGMLSLRNCPDPAGYERGTYAMGLQGWNNAKPSIPRREPLA